MFFKGFQSLGVIVNDAHRKWFSNVLLFRRPTLYIGESDHGLYALSSLVDQSVAVLPDNIYPNRLLIGGPQSKDDTAVILGEQYFEYFIVIHLVNCCSARKI